MARSADYICVDWGLSRFRAALCAFADGVSLVQDTLNGPGVMSSRRAIEETLFEMIAPWTCDHGAVPILLSGGVWSNIGWRNTPYLACPFDPQNLSSHCTTFEARGRDIVIVPGLECTNSFGEADTMRSEELQILGWLQSEQSGTAGDRLMCLPGTHTKWVTIKDGRIQSFQTAVTGELYGLLSEHSILLAQNGEPAGQEIESDDAFFLGVAAGREAGGNLSHALFSTRSRQLTGELDVDGAESYLSGMLIAADVMGAIESLQPLPESVFLVGEPALCAHFSRALQAFGLKSETMDGNDAALRGFSVIFRDLYQREREQSVSA